MKHIEIVDGALNSRFELYAVTDQVFDLLFPAEEDEIYLEELSKELQEDGAFWDQVYAREVDRRTVHPPYASQSENFCPRTNRYRLLTT